MEEILIAKEINEIVESVFKDYGKGRTIDTIHLYNKPDKNEVKELTQELLQIVFPGYFRSRAFKVYNPKNSFAVLIEDTFYHLNKQILLALDFCKMTKGSSSEEKQKESYSICKAFFEKIPMIREYIDCDLQAAFDGDPAAGCKEEIILAYPGIAASSINRIAHELYLLQVPVLPRMMTEYAHSETGIDIHPGATIGKYFFIDHGTGVVIGETSVIGNNVKIYQGVTIGALSTRGGQKLSGKKRHPTIEPDRKSVV